MDKPRVHSAPRRRSPPPKVPTVFEYAQNPFRQVSNNKCDTFHPLSGIAQESLPTLKIQALNVDVEWEATPSTPIDIPIRQLGPIRSLLPRKDEWQFRKMAADQIQSRMHRMSVQPAGENVSRRRCLVWVPTKPVKEKKVRSRSCPLFSSPSLQSSVHQPANCLHVALLPTDMKYDILPRYPKIPPLPKLKKSVRFKQTPQLLGPRISDSFDTPSRPELQVSVSGSSLTDMAKSSPRTKLLEPVAVPTAVDDKVPKPKTKDAITSIPASGNEAVDGATSSNAQQSQQQTQQQLTLPVKQISGDFPSVSHSKTSLSAEILSGSITSVLRGGKEPQLSPRAVSPTLSRITLPQAPFESSSIAASASGTSLNSIKASFHNLKLSHQERVRKSDSAVVLEGEGLQLSPRALPPRNSINVVIPSSEAVRDEVKVPDDFEDDHQPSVPPTPAQSLVSRSLPQTPAQSMASRSMEEEESSIDTSMGFPTPS